MKYILIMLVMLISCTNKTKETEVKDDSHNTSIPTDVTDNIDSNSNRDTSVDEERERDASTIDTDSESELHQDDGGNAEMDSDTESYESTDSERDSGSDTESGSDTVEDTDSDTETESETESETTLEQIEDAGTDSGPETDTDTETETESETEPEVDSWPQGPCVSSTKLCYNNSRYVCMWNEWHLEEECSDTQVCSVEWSTCYTPDPPEYMYNYPRPEELDDFGCQNFHICVEKRHVYVIDDCVWQPEGYMLIQVMHYLITCPTTCYMDVVYNSYVMQCHE